jgi:hypothetical protein
MKWIIMILLVSIFALGCEMSVDLGTTEIDATAQDNSADNVAENEETPQEPDVEQETTGCKVNSDCSAGKVCIDNQCGIIREIHQTEDCTETCNYNEITVLTNEGDTLILPPGKGSYTAGGGIEWKISSAPDYCKGEETIVPFKILLRSGGKAIHEEVVTVKVGETSKEIVHPNSEKYKITLTVKEINEVCE